MSNLTQALTQPLTFPLIGGYRDLLGRTGSSGTLPTAPVLAMDPSWVTTDNTPDFTITIDDTVVAGDSVRLEVAAAGTLFAAPISDTTHIITAPEDAANQISLGLSALPNAAYEARANDTHTTTSNWSNTVPFTIAAVSATSTFYILGF